MGEGAVPYIVGYLAVPLVSTRPFPAAPQLLPTSCNPQKSPGFIRCPQGCPTVPGLGPLIQSKPPSSPPAEFTSQICLPLPTQPPSLALRGHSLSPAPAKLLIPSCLCQRFQKQLLSSIHPKPLKAFPALRIEMKILPELKGYSLFICVPGTVLLPSAPDAP